MESRSISVRQATQFAWPTFKKQYRLFFTALLSIFLAWVLLEVVVIAGQRFGIGLWALAHLAFLLFFAGVEAGLVKISLGLHDGQQPATSEIFAYMRLGPKLLLGQILHLLLVGIGLVLLLIPGLYLWVQYFWFGFGFLDGETNLMRSFQQSALLTTGVKLHLLTILALLLIVNLLGASILGVGLLITIPFSILTLTFLYRQLNSKT